MDDPWANAWGEAAKPQPSVPLSSWSTDAPVSWTEPSALWMPSDPAPTGWASSDDDPKVPSPASPQADDQTPPLPEPASPEPTSESNKEPEITSTTPPANPETDQPDLDPWATGSVVSSAEPERENVWVPSWGTPDQEMRTENSVDEWEEAKRQKARQDEHVPPELLLSILDDFKSLSGDLWPTQSPLEDHSGARNGLESVQGLENIPNRLIPHDLTLPSSVQFPKTFIAKHMGDALRLSRHVPITRLSPFTLYMASKGSTAWEISVKSRIEGGNDDLLPPGWRVVEKEKEDPVPATETKKKSSGGLLSFFGKKSTNTPVESNPRRSESPGRKASISTTVPASSGAVPSTVTHSTRPSSESANSNLPSSDTFTHAASQSSSQTPVPSIPEQTQVPSAVSRFLGRFARNKTSGSGAKEPLALSTDDLEFLSDIVPSANDDVDENDQMRGLSDMLNSSPLSAALPPLLAPPPRAPPVSLISENLTQLPKPAVNPQDDMFSIFDSPLTMNNPTTAGVQPNASSLPPQLPSKSIAPLRPPPTSSSKSESQGAPSSSRSSGRSSPFDTSTLTSRSQTPSLGRRAPVAIMSTGSSSSNGSRSIATLSLPPILPPPPPTKFTSTPSHSRTSSQHNIFEDDNDLASFRVSPVPQSSLLSDTSTPSVFSDKSLFSDTSSQREKSNNDFFDDFDDFVSSPIRDPSPPRPPAKPSFLSQPAIAPTAQVPTQNQSPTEHPSLPPRKTSRAADHQRTLSLVNLAASRTGRWPAPPSPLPSPLAPPPGGSHSSTTGPSSSLMQTQQKNAIGAVTSSAASSGYPFFPPPPGFSGLQKSTISPSPPPRLATASPAPIANLMQNGLEASRAPVPAAPKYQPSATPGGLSAQDLSFFEGL